MSCSGTITIDKKVTEREEAVDFYKGAYPISKEIRDVSDDWNSFLQRGADYKANPIEHISMCRELRSRLEGLQNDLSKVYAPVPLRQLKNNIALCITTGIEAFSLGEQCATYPEFETCNKADEKILELNRLLMIVADEWDDGLAHYNIRASEFLP